MYEGVFWLTLVGIQLVGGVLALRFASTLAGLKSPTLIRAITIVLAIAASQAAVVWLCKAAGVPGHFLALIALVILPVVCFGALAISGLNMSQALRGIAVLAVSAMVIGGFELWAIRFAFETYSVPTNGMAPTIRGRHLLGVCPHCGGPTVVGIRQPANEAPVPFESGICTVCYRVSSATQIGKKVQMGDRIVVSRLATPRRFDLVAFQFPLEPQQIFTQRLVGLPGEEIEIIEGAIFINGEKITPPPEIAKVTWHESPDGTNTSIETYAIRGESVRLADDECFTLGDNSHNSYDSRYWGPVPKENFVGVVECVYFPPCRWQTFPRHK